MKFLLKPTKKAENIIKQIDEIGVHTLEKEELVAEVIDELYIAGKEQATLKIESIDKSEAHANEKEELIAEVDEELLSQNTELGEFYSRQTNDEEAKKGAALRNEIAQRMWQNYVLE